MPADDPLGKLQRFEWRGIPLPLTSRNATFESGTILHDYQFKDGQLVEGIGTQNLVLTYGIPFREGLRRHYKDLYTKLFASFFAACQDRTEGPLVDPYFGRLNAKLRRFTVTTDVNRRDGEDVQVEFVHAPAPADAEIEPPELAASLVAAAEATLAVLPPELEEPDIGVDALTAIANAPAGFEAQVGIVTAQVSGVVSKLETIEEQLVELGDPTEWEAIRSVRSLQLRARNLVSSAAARHRAVVQLVTTAPQTAASLAASTGMSVQDVLALNPVAAKTPVVPPGTTVKYYQEKAA